MDRRRKTTAAVGAFVLLGISIGGVCGYLLGRGEAVPPAHTPSSESAEDTGLPAPAQEGESEDVVRQRVEARAARSERVRLALREIESEDAGVRERCLRTLVDAGYDHAEIVRLVVRTNVPAWQGRSLADLLSSDSATALPPLLHRIAYSAPRQRAQICQALGAPRDDTRAASAVLAARALLDSFVGVRERALTALQEIDPAAAEAVSDHYAKGLTLADGSVSGLDASLLVDDGCPYARSASRQMLVEALKAEGARFGGVTVIRVGAFLAPLPEGGMWFQEAMQRLLAYDSVDEEGSRLLASVGPALVPLLRHRLMEPDAPAYVAHVLGDLAPRARIAVPDLLRVVVERRPIWRPALMAAARLSSGRVNGASQDADVDALLPLLHDEQMGAHVAWALGEMRATSPEAIQALCTRMAHRIGFHHGGSQAECALKRLVAAGRGFGSVAALLQTEHLGVVRAAIRVLSLCHERDRSAAEELVADVRSSTADRSVRRTAESALRLLRAGELVRSAELQRQISVLTRDLAEE